MVETIPTPARGQEATERIALPAENWWVIRTRLTRGMEKAITRVSLAAIPRLEANGQTELTAEKVTGQLLSNVGAVDVGRIEDAYLLHGTVSYSYGPAVDLETIDAIDAEVVRTVINRMFELYNQQRLTEEQRTSFLGTPSPAT